MIEWIKISDKLPPFYENHYLVSDGIDISIMRWKFWRSWGTKKEWIFDDPEGNLSVDILYWMPLPALPPNPPEME